jgi:peptidoglycan/LPS O-acetylase OafA/YrhL
MEARAEMQSQDKTQRISTRISSDTSHIAGLDGLRAVAALGVVAFHLGLHDTSRLKFVAVGWSGVNLFFVLSGFLITTILLQDRNNKHYYSPFYLRRSLRIFPIYYLVLSIMIFWSVSEGRSVSEWPRFATFTQNLLLSGKRVSDFAVSLGHTWTLAIEEQFYLLWPLAVRNLPTRLLKRVVIVLILIGPISRYFAAWRYEEDIYKASIAYYAHLFCYFDMLAWGALGAIVYHEQTFGRDRIEFVAKCGLALGAAIIGCIIFRDGFASINDSFYSGWGQLVFSSCGPIYLSLLILAMSGGMLTRALELRPVRYCGRISYGLYLYHYPVLIFLAEMNYRSSEWERRFIVLGATFAISAASYHWIERPILKAKDRFFPRFASNSTPRTTTAERIGIGEGIQTGAES